MKALFIITAGFALTYLFLLVSEDKFVKMPPLYNGSMTSIRLQALIDYGTTRILYIGLVYLLWYCLPNERGFLTVVLILFVLYFIDYCLSYNNPYAYLVKGQLAKTKPELGIFIPLSYPLFMGFSLIILTCLRILKSL